MTVKSFYNVATGAIAVKLFACNSLIFVFVPGKPFQPSQMLYQAERESINTLAYLSGASSDKNLYLTLTLTML